MVHSFLRRKGSGFVFRRRVPADLVSVLGRREIVRALGPCDARTARRMARELAVDLDRLFDMARGRRRLNREIADDLARRQYTILLDGYERQLARCRDDAAIERERDKARSDFEGVTELLTRNQWLAASEVAGELLAEHHVSCDVGDDIQSADQNFIDLCRKLQRAFISAAQVALARFEGDYAAEPNDPLFKAAGLPAWALPDRILLLPPSRPESVVSEPGSAAESAPNISLDAAIERYIDAASWTEHTRRQNARFLGFFADFVGDVRLSRVSKRDVAAYRAKLSQLPANWGKSSAYRGLSLDDVLRLADRRDAKQPRISDRTVQKQLSACAGLFSWAIQAELISGPNPFQGHARGKRSRSRTPKRRPWRREELRILFDAPTWRGRGATSSISPGRFFIPLIAVYSGMRLEEIAKLGVERVRETDGIYVIDIVDDEYGRVKEDASQRTVPVHPKLVELGLIAYVEKRRREVGGKGHLWPDLKPSAVNGTYGHYLSKWFAQEMRRAGLEQDKGRVFHSFRNTVISALDGAGINQTTINDITGHAQQGMGPRTYREGASARRMYEALAKIDYGLDLSHVKRRAETLFGVDNHGRQCQ